jgi:imidazolonepropionase
MILIKNIKALLQVRPALNATPLAGLEQSFLPVLENAFLLIEQDRIADFGEMSRCPLRSDVEIDAFGRMVMPTWCDSHTHIVYAAAREEEFVQRIQGVHYEMIAAKGGGILNSARRLQNMPESELLAGAVKRIEEARSLGTGAMEIKSGYGLTLESELKMLRVIRRLKSLTDMTIKATFLGAHAIPLEFKQRRNEYISLIINKMLPIIAAENLADFIDVFCEKIAFSVSETERILEAGVKYGLKPKIHTNQFHSMGGIEAAVKYGAISVDHLEILNEREMVLLKNHKTIATLLPTAPFFLNDSNTPPARQLMNKGIPVALATDCNPGTSPSVSMPFVWSLSCIRLRMTPEEGFNAVTWNGACAMEVQNDLGCIAKGKIANLILTKPVPSVAYLPYSFGTNWIEKTILKGNLH